ncbi:MAG: TonB-dependent receptor, partial [Asticcacaulis sp.]|nr:TonB-dependent receptor [Asticcacaulis sp.]
MPVTRKTSARLLALLGTASALAVALSAGEAFAQGSPSTDTTEVVVTASRRAEKNKDVPTADTVISGQKLEILNSSGQDIRFLSARTPGLTIESSFGRTYPRLYIRGLGNSDFDANAAQPVSIVYDDVALENPMLKSSPVYDLASVEVLRGPQGTLFGRNTPAGVVKLDSAKPSDTFGGFISGSEGTFNTINLEGAITGPIADGLNFRISGMEQHRDDWVTNTSTTGVANSKLEGYTDRAARFQLSYTKGDFSALFNIHGRTLDGTPRIFRAGLFKQGSNDFNTGFDIKTVALDGVTSQHLFASGVNLHLNYDFDGIGTLHSVTAYETTKVESSGDIDGGNVYTFPPLALNQSLFPSSTGGTTKPNEFSQELRFETVPVNGVRGQFGVYYFDQHLNYNEVDYTMTGAVDANLKHVDHATNYGVFASGEWTATDRLTVRGGLRYSSDKKTDSVSGTPVATGVTLPATLTVKGNNVSGDISATYVVTPAVNWYARYATGYLGPAIQDRVNFVFDKTGLSSAKPETVDSLETGIKGAFFDHKVTLDADVFGYTVKNMQLTAVGGTNNSAHLINAKKVDAYGAEIDLTAHPITPLLITAGVSYTSTEIKDAGITVGKCGSLCTMIDPLDSNGNAIINGNPLPQAPKWVSNVTAKYTWPLAGGSQ